MKKVVFVLLLLYHIPLFAQLSWQGGSAPFPDQSATLLFDATGTPLENYSGTIYAHTGVTINNSTHWVNVIGTWGDNNVQPALTLIAGNIYSLDYTPTINDFYSNPTGSITAIDIVLRSSDGSIQTSPDYNIHLAQNTLTLTSPTEDPVIVNSGTQITISATTTFISNFSLKANGPEINTASGTNYSYDFIVTEDTDFILEANDGYQVLSLSFSARLTPLYPVPDGMLDGINVDPNDDTKVTLVLYAPGKQTVHVIGDFNNWLEDDNYLMNYDTAREKYWIQLTGLTPQSNHMYQYLVDSSIKIADPYSTIILDPVEDQYINSTTYPNLPAYPTGLTNYDVTLLRTGDPEYNWQVTNFQKPEKTDLVIYELLIRDFDALHSFDAVKARLDYLQSLGVNAIELMPVNEFDGNLNWGYSPAFHMALDKYYGTANAFKQLIDECHSRGIAVILDVVFNHATGQNPYYRLWNTDNGGYYGQASLDSPFFNQTPRHAYNVYNDFNHQSSATQKYVERIVKYWIKEYKVDGFRWDLTKGFTQNCPSQDMGCTDGYQQDRVDVLKQYADYQWEVDPNFLVIFEHLGGITEEKEWADYRANEGKGIMLWNNLNGPYGQATIGNNMNNASDFWNVYYSNKGFDGPSAVSYMESHDEERNMYKNLQDGKSSGSYNVKDLNTALDRMETAGAFFFTVPGPKMIWQFGELGYDYSINYCANGTVNNTCRTDAKPIRWDYLDNPNRKSIYDTWSKLIDLKHNEPIFKTTDFQFAGYNVNGRKSIHLTKADATGNGIKYVTIIGNFGLTTQSIDPEFQETGTWYNLLDRNSRLEVSNVTSPIELAPGEFRIYGNNPYIDSNDLDSDGVPNADDLCPGTPLETIVDVTGCPVFTLPSDNFTVQISSETCRSSNNGSMTVTAQQNLNYTINITGNGINSTDTFTTNYTSGNLAAGEYTACITVDGQPDYEICFNATVDEPKDLSVFSIVSNSDGIVSIDMSGSTNYLVTFNGTTFETTNNSLKLGLKSGANNLTVKGDQICQGIYEETIYYNSKMMVFPNPVTNDMLSVYLGNGKVSEAKIMVFSILGEVIYNEMVQPKNNTARLDFRNFSKGIYILKIFTNNENASFKVIK